MPIPPDHCNQIPLLFTSDIRLSTEPRTCAHEKTFAPCVFRPPTAPKAEIMGITALTIPKQLPSPAMRPRRTLAEPLNSHTR
jgi:hypothetical protein